MLALSAPNFDVQGSLVALKGYASQGSTGRRAKRVATLDGSAVLVDGGYSVADLTFELTVDDPLGRQHGAINRLMRYHTSAVLACAHGLYSVKLSALRHTDGAAVVSAEVLGDLA